MMHDIIEKQESTSVIAQQAISADLFERWIKYIDAKPKTLETYTRAVKQFLLFLQENGISRPTREDIAAYRDSLRETHKANTVRLYLVAVKLFFSWTAAEGFYPNIAERVKNAKVERGHKKDYLTSEQAKQTLQGVEDVRDYAILSLMMTTGLRTVEVIRANVEDLRARGNGTVLYLQGKGRDDKSEFVKVSAPVEKAIRAYLKERGKTEDKQPLFASAANRNRGSRMTTRSISRICKNSLVSAGFDSDRLTAHSLRHTAATLNLLNGGTLEETQQLLRHTNVNTTMVYLHNLRRDENNSEERITDAIFG